MTAHFDPKQIAESGERIYRQRFQRDFETLHTGRFAAIDISTEIAYLGDTAFEALQQAQFQAPDGTFYLVLVGSPAAFRMGHSFVTANGDADRAFR